MWRREGAARVPCTQQLQANPFLWWMFTFYVGCRCERPLAEGQLDRSTCYWKSPLNNWALTGILWLWAMSFWLTLFKPNLKQNLFQFCQYPIILCSEQMEKQMRRKMILTSQCHYLHKVNMQVEYGHMGIKLYKHMNNQKKTYSVVYCLRKVLNFVFTFC